MANEPTPLFGPGGLPIGVPDLSPKKSSWKCNKCGHEPQDSPNGTPGDANITQLPGEPANTYHASCLVCRIKWERKTFGQYVRKEQLTKTNGS